MSDYRDVAVAHLAADEADLRALNRQLVDLLADVAFENAVLRVLWQDEYLGRIYRDYPHQQQRDA